MFWLTDCVLHYLNKRKHLLLLLFPKFWENSIKAEHDKYSALINETHDFNGGLKGLETLDNDKGQETFKNIKTEKKL